MIYIKKKKINILLIFSAICDIVCQRRFRTYNFYSKFLWVLAGKKLMTVHFINGSLILANT